MFIRGTIPYFLYVRRAWLTEVQTPLCPVRLHSEGGMQEPLTPLKLRGAGPQQAATERRTRGALQCF